MFDQAFIHSLTSSIVKGVVAELKENGPVQPRLMDFEQAARYLGIFNAEGLPSVTAMRQRKQAGQIPDYCWMKLGANIMFDRHGLDRWINEMIEDK